MKRVVKSLFILLFWLIILGALFILGAFVIFSRNIPDPETIILRRVNESTKIFDRSGETVLFDVYGAERRTILPLESIPKNIQQAVVAIEDANFYKHEGLDIRGIIRAALMNIRKRSITQGGSTITQQLIKNSLLTRERTFSRKFKELILALEIERRFDKDQIMWMYLNQIPFGSNVYGVGEAARFYFNKPVDKLTLGETATLAALIRAPSYYSPFGSHRDLLLERKDFVLDRMAKFSMITDKQRADAQAMEITFDGNETSILAPHFVIMVREYLVEKYGEDLVQNGGLRVYTTLNWDMQQKAEELLKKYGEINEKRYGAKNAALTALDPKTGQILALVGSIDYFDKENDGNFNVATALRQPGSAIKPLVYATALEKGFTDKTILFDVPTEFNPDCDPAGTQERNKYGGECYHPQNYNNTHLGPVTIRQALANSLNVPAVKTLYLAGLRDSIQQAQRLGISSFTDTDRYGLSLVLGGAEIRLVELTSAFSVFANDGLKNKPVFILKVETAQGTVLEEYEKNEQRVVSQQTARTLNDILSDNIARTPVFGPHSPLFIPEKQVAAKTGTTQSFRDAWTIGYTPTIAVGVWTGNNDNTKMRGNAAGSNVAGPLWKEFTVAALSSLPDESFSRPDPVFVDKIMLNGNYILKTPSSNSSDSFSKQKNDEFEQNKVSQVIHTILYFVNKTDPRGFAPLNPAQDPQYKNWEWAVQNWFNK